MQALDVNVDKFVRSYFKAMEQGQVAGREAHWYTPDVEQVEWPNALMPKGATRNFESLRATFLRLRTIVVHQSYDLKNIVVSNNNVAVEADYRAVFSVDLPALPRGKVLDVRCAIFLELERGRIRRHRTYDCFMHHS